MPNLVPAPDLFDVSPLPAGLDYQADFLMVCEEAELLPAIAALPFREATFQQYTARRRVVWFGQGYDPGGAERTDVGPMPDWLADIRARVAERQRVAPDAFAHALVTEYRPGTPIGWHRDRPEYGMVVGISLGSPVRMRFRPYDNQRDRSAIVTLELAPRSLYVMRDEIRWRWQHGIPPAKALRYSITFRTPA